MKYKLTHCRRDRDGICRCWLRCEDGQLIKVYRARLQAMIVEGKVQA